MDNLDILSPPKDRLHIVHVLSQLDCIGGTARVLLYLLKHADRNQVRHSFICMLPGELQAEFEREGAVVKVINSTTPWRVTTGIFNYARELNPDVFATHFTRPLICSSLVARVLRLPLVHNEHGAAFKLSDDASLGARASNLMRKWALQASQLVICNSHYTAATIADTFNIERALLRPLHLPVENRAGIPREHVLDDVKSVVTIGHVGGMIALRDQATLIQAIGVLRAKGVDARLIMVGDGPERAALEALAVRLQLRPWITFAGYQTNLESFYECIDIYANPAIGEGFGIAVVEAMLAYKPVVLANAGAHPELIDHGVSGLLHEPGSSESLANNLGILISDPHRLKLITVAARNRADELFSPRKYAKQFESIVARAACSNMTSRKNYHGQRAF